MKNVYILSVESTCDETSIAIVKNGTDVISHTVLSQIETHKHFGGVVPEIASRMHCENITIVLEETLKKSEIKLSEIDAIAVSYAPGLLGSLLVGIEFAKTLSYVLKKPLIKVNHLIGHIYATKLEYLYDNPAICLVVSGGHTELLLMEGEYDFKLLGQTLDDAIGECYDKVARVLNIPYPGGPGVETKALLGEDAYKFKKLLDDGSYNFSYSGLKSNVINVVNNCKQKKETYVSEDLAKSFQVAAVEQITRKLELALIKTNVKNIVVAGGVSANNYLREQVSITAKKYLANVFVPSMKYCTDNAAMIGAAAYPLYQKKNFVILS